MKLVDLNPILETLHLDPLAYGLQIVAAREVADDYFPRLDTDRPALVAQFDMPDSLARAARTLRVNYPASHRVTLVRGSKQKTVALDALPLERTTRRAVLYIPPLPHSSSPLTLANIMAHLRAPVGGCPWDLEQTHASITRALIEEAYEVIEAIADHDMLHLMEELGDLQLHVLFQTQIARDENQFALSDVGAELAAKLIRRHPHVFGNEQAKDANGVLENWEKIKQAEKARKGETSQPQALDAGIPRELPALTRAQKVHERARRKQNQTSNVKRVENVRRNVPRRNVPSSDALKQEVLRARDRERAVGDLLFELAALAEQHGIDAERALRAATTSFVREKSMSDESSH
ncbi:MAG: nucleoside triphosphate pyrophosphohydrolase [Chloroflexi bacterium]|nr:nucleoside triphosphate pyrophosphohydrolase [Chloroflexota bacterium]